MEDNEVIVTEDEFAGFDDGWDDETRDTGRGEGDEGDGEVSEGGEEDGAADGEEDAAAEGSEEAEDKGKEGGETSEAEGDHAEGGDVEQPERYVLKHLDETREVGRDEVVALAQQGLDYARIRRRADEYEAFLKEIAGDRPVVEVMDSVRAERLVKEQGIDRQTALARVKFEREKAAFESENAERAEQVKRDEQRQKDLAAFAAARPDVKAHEIPREVWADFRDGISLIDAYGRFENKQLRERVKVLETEVAAAKQNTINKERAAGSRASAGRRKETDPFDDGWDDTF